MSHLFSVWASLSDVCVCVLDPAKTTPCAREKSLFSLCYEHDVLIAHISWTFIEAAIHWPPPLCMGERWDRHLYVYVYCSGGQQLASIHCVGRATTKKCPRQRCVCSPQETVSWSDLIILERNAANTVTKYILFSFSLKNEQIWKKASAVAYFIPERDDCFFSLSFLKHRVDQQSSLLETTEGFLLQQVARRWLRALQCSQLIL